MATTAKKTTPTATPRQASAKRAKDAEGVKPAEAAGGKIELVAKVEAPKKAKAPAATPLKAAPKKENVVAISQPGIVSRETIEQAAYLKWVERGRRYGYALEDWIQAEHELRGRAS